MLVEKLSEEKRMFIFDEVVASVDEVATSAQGRCVLKKLVPKTKLKTNRQAFYDAAFKHSEDLI
jgi:hypothetical protein